MNVTDKKNWALQLALMVFVLGVVSVPQEVGGETIESTGECIEQTVVPNAISKNAREEEIRAFLSRIVNTEYCGDAMAAGVSHGAALRGKAPVEGGGNVHVEQEEWFPILHEMTLEEFHRLARESDGNSIMDIGHLGTMLSLFREATEKREEALDALRTMAEEAPPNWNYDFFTAISCAWIDLAMGNDDVNKCIELGRIFDKNGGVDSKGVQCFIDALGRCDAFGRSQIDADRAVLSRFVLDAAERCTTSRTAGTIDIIAAGHEYYYPGDGDPLSFGKPKIGVAGWEGSLQRRNLAARFEKADGHMAQLLRSSTITERAQNESELTDLRQVYGDWSRDKVEE